MQVLQRGKRLLQELQMEKLQEQWPKGRQKGRHQKMGTLVVLRCLLSRCLDNLPIESHLHSFERIQACMRLSYNTPCFGSLYWKCLFLGFYAKEQHESHDLQV